MYNKKNCVYDEDIARVLVIDVRSVMSVTFMEILEDEIFDEAVVMTGDGGLCRDIRRVSVFDCPYHEDMMEEGVIEEGDLFLSCLEQFPAGNDDITQFFEGMIKYKVAGLMIVPTGRTDLVNDRLTEMCGSADFPVIVVRRSNSYANIMEVVNKYIAIGSINEINRHKLAKIRGENLSIKENVDIINSINADVKENIIILSVEGTLHSPLFSMDLWRCYQENSNDILVMGEPFTLILSGTDTRQLQQRANAAAAQIKDRYSDYRIGFSRIYEKQEIADALAESEDALRASSLCGVQQYTYEPLSSFQLMMALKDKREARHFFDAYKKAISAKTSSDMLAEMMKTIELYVENGGDYKKTAEQINQHENTVRYRVNRVKSALGMENDIIRFHETISIASKLKLLLENDFDENIK